MPFTVPSCHFPRASGTRSSIRVHIMGVLAPGGGGSAKMWSSMLEKNCVESCGHKMGMKFVRVSVIWI